MQDVPWGETGCMEMTPWISAGHQPWEESDDLYCQQQFPSVINEADRSRKIMIYFKWNKIVSYFQDDAAQKTVMKIKQNMWFFCRWQKIISIFYSNLVLIDFIIRQFSDFFDTNFATEFIIVFFLYNFIINCIFCLQSESRNRLLFIYI